MLYVVQWLLCETSTTSKNAPTQLFHALMTAFTHLASRERQPPCHNVMLKS
jgi:hypothetical protein